MLLVACATAAPPVAKLPPAGQLVDPGAAPFVAAERYRGKVVVLDFWAGWCDECKRTVPQVARLAAAFADQGLVVVGVNAGETLDAARAAARSFAIGYPIALDPELAFSDRLGAGTLPSLVVIGRDGAIVHRARHVDSETLEIIRRLLSR